MNPSKKPRPFQKEDYFRLKFLQSAALSPDGQTLLYGLLYTDLEADADYVDLWRLDLSGGETRQLTYGAWADYNPRWSPDGRVIAFLSSRGDKPQVYLIDPNGGEARSLTAMPQGVSSGPVWSPDGRWIAFTAGLPEERLTETGKPYRVNRHVYRANGINIVDRAVQNLHLIPAGGGDVIQLTDDDYIDTEPVWSPDGSQILYFAQMPPDSHNIFFPRLRVVDIETRTVRELVSDWGSGFTANWLPDGKRIAFIGSPYRRPGPFAGRTDLWLIDAETEGAGPQRCTAAIETGLGTSLAPDMPSALRYAGGIHFTSDGKNAYIPVHLGGCNHIYRVGIGDEANCEPVVTGNRACMLLGLSADERSLLYGVSDFNDPMEIFIANRDGTGEKQLTQVNTALLSARALPEVEKLQFYGADGTEVEGWILKPPYGQPPYPTLLNIHGGPYNANGHIYHSDSQILAGAGYAVLMVNYRGSTGYGERFSLDLPEKGWGKLNYTDMMAGVDHAIELGLADPNRLGVFGISAGGYGTCWVVGQTDRFRAAVSENPVTNWLSLYGTSDIGAWWVLEEFGGQPHEIAAALLEASPVMHAHKCRTPTLMIQGEQDWRCPPEQSEQFYTVLKAHGCVVEMLRLPGGSHGSAIVGPPVMRRAQNDALLDWMNRYVLGEDARH